MPSRPKRQLKKRNLGNESADNFDDELEELEDEEMLGDDNSESDEADDSIPDDGELEEGEGYDNDGYEDEDLEEDDEDEIDDEFTRNKSSKSNRKNIIQNNKNHSSPIQKNHKNKTKQNYVSIKYKSSTNLLITLSLNKNKISNILNKSKSRITNKKESTSKSNSISKSNVRTRKIKVKYTEPNEDDFGSDFEENGEIPNNDSLRNSDDNDSEENDDPNLNDEGNDTNGNESDIELAKLSERQRSKVLGLSEEPEEVINEFYNGKKLPKSVLALMEGGTKKKPLTEEEIQLRKAEAARKRKTFNMRKLESEKKETLKKLLHRKIEKVDAKKVEEENERRKLNSRRRELITHKALFSWVSKTDVVDGQKTDVSLYSLQ